MKIELHKYRKVTNIDTVDKAIEIAKTLEGGDLGIIIITFNSEDEEEEFDKKYDIDNQGEWRFNIREHN
jgi:hypothetical protein